MGDLMHYSITPTHTPVSPRETEHLAPFLDFSELERPEEDEE